jgi:hypothetical protein
MKKKYIKPTIGVVKLMNGCSLLNGSGKSYDNLHNNPPIPIFSGDEDDIIDEDDVI